MKEKVNIICLYWVGEFRGRNFTENDVWRLHQTVSKHIDRDFDFYVLTNDLKAELPGTSIPLINPEEWPGWWSKMDLHRTDLPAGRTLYLDLDSHVIRSLQPILDTPGDLVMFPSRMSGSSGGIVSRYQAATMLFDPGEMERKYQLFSKFQRDDDYWMAHYRSEQDIMGEWIPDQPTFLDKWLMKARLIKRTRPYRKHPPKDVIIITGQPKNNFFREHSNFPWLEQMARG